MGLACPVCDVPHPDGEHLADHVAITATTRRDDHRAWLDEHAPDWQESTRAELGALLAEHAEEVDSIDLHEELDEHRHGDNRHGDNRHWDYRHGDHGHGTPGQGAPESANFSGELDEEARAVLAEARKLTERMADADDEYADDEE